MEISELVQSLNQKVLLLAFTQKLNRLFVRADDHIGEHLLALALRTDLVIVDLLNAVAALANLFLFQLLSFDTELEVEFAAGFQRLLSVVCIPLDVLKKFVRGILVRV